MGLFGGNPHLLGQPAVSDVAVVAERATPPERVKGGVSSPFPVAQLSIRQSAKKLYEDEGRKYKNHLNQEFDTSKPNEVWVSDVTYFKYGENAYYICVIIDLFSRMVVGYKIGKTNSTQLVKSTFQIAYKARQPDSSLIFHTDRGGNYRSKTMNDYMRSLHITHSFSRAHVPYDISVVESFFS